MTSLLDEWRQSGREYRHKNQRIFFRDSGDGPVLLCLHGFPTSSYDWHKIWPRLGRFRSIAPDLLGYGYSDKPRDYPYSTFDQTDMVEGLLASLGVGSVAVLAHDYGDTVAQELLARREERLRKGVPGLEVRSVCFLNGGLFPEAARVPPILRALLSPVGGFVAGLVTEKLFSRRLAAVFGPETQPSDRELAEMWRIAQHQNGARLGHKLIRYVRERGVYRDRWVSAMQETEVPLRLVAGSMDPISGLGMIERYRQLIPRPDVVVLWNIGHYPQLEAPQEVADNLIERPNAGPDGPE